MIKTIVFDLSEVLIPGLIGIEERLESITSIPSDLIAKALGSHPHHEIDNNLEKLLKGSITYQNYRSGFIEKTGLPNNFEDTFDKECLKMFETPYAHTEELLRRTSESCELYLLSDHCEIWATYIQEKHNFLRHFSGVLWSYEVSATKKSKIPFEALSKKYALNPLECLFVDDNQRNITIAGTMGFHTIHFLGPNSVQDIYRAIENG